MTVQFPLVDVHADLGRFQTQDVGPGSVEVLLDEMATLGIDRAMVTNSVAYLQDPAAGNELILSQTARVDQLLPCWTVLPDSCDELAPPADFVAEATARGVVAIRAYPFHHGYPLDGASMSSVLGHAAAARLILIVDSTETTFGAIATVAQRHPELSIVVSHLGYRTLRPASDLLRTWPNTYLDLANLATHQGIEYLVARFGPSRLLFSTGAPQRDGAEAVCRLLWSGLDDQAVQAIGHGNIERLLDRRAS